MINLIKNELCKIFHKKSIYILFGISTAIIVLTNIIYSSIENISNNNENNINVLREEIDQIDLSNQDNIDWYISNKTEIDKYELQKKYGFDSWQSYVINNNTEYLYQINYNTYSFNKDLNLLKENTNKLNNLIKKIDNNDWRIFVEEEKIKKNEELTQLNEELKLAKGSPSISKINNQIYNVNANIELLNMRLDRNIPYGNDYLNNALNQYIASKLNIHEYENKELTYEEKLTYQNTKNNLETSKYIIETGYNINETNNMRSMYKSFYNEYLYLILAVVIVVSGVIVSEEYNKGTIKLLLVKPYTRTKILCSKYITCLIIMVLSILTFFLIQTIAGYLFFGGNSLNIPIVNYNFNSSTLSIMNVWTYFGIMTISMLPKIILILTLSFSLGTIFGNSAIAIAVPFVGLGGAELFNYLIISKNVSFMKYWVTLNWDFNIYLFGGLSNFKYVNFPLSVIVCLVYLFIMIIVSFLVFKKKNIKNI